MDKFLGIGLKNAVGLALFVMLLILLAKVAFNKYHVPGVSESVNAL